MIYLDNGATSFHKPPSVYRAVKQAMSSCANPGRGGYAAAENADRAVFHCRMAASSFFQCEPEQVIFTSNCTHSLNIAIRTIVKPGDTVAVSGFEHNAVIRPLHALGANIKIAGRKLFDVADTLTDFEKALRKGADAAVFTHVSNVFGYVLPVREMAALCRQYGVPFVIDAAQSAGMLPVSLKDLQADFIAMPGHKSLLGPQGTGILLCGHPLPSPILYGGTGSASMSTQMPDMLPDRLEAGTLNVPGIAGLAAGIKYLQDGKRAIFCRRAQRETLRCVHGLQKLGVDVFAGDSQLATVSFLPGEDCEEFAAKLAKAGVAVRGGLHCAPLAHDSAGTLNTGAVRVSFGHDANEKQTCDFLKITAKIMNRTKIFS